MEDYLGGWAPWEGGGEGWGGWDEGGDGDGDGDIIWITSLQQRKNRKKDRDGQTDTGERVFPPLDHLSGWGDENG